MTPEPALSVLIVNWNTRDLLLACLASLRREAQALPLEILVADNASSDGSAEAVRREFPETILLVHPVNRGFAAAVNAMLKRSTAPYCLLLNPDTEVQPGALQILSHELQSDPQLMAVGPQLLNPDGSIQPSGRRFPGLLRFLGEGLLPGFCLRSPFWIRATYGRTDFSVPAAVDELSGACVLIRRECFERIGLLDENYFLYFEEVDWFVRLAKTNAKIKYQPQARVTHHWGAGTRQTQGQSIITNYQSAIYYWHKHAGWAGGLAARLITFMHAVAALAGRFILTVLGQRPKADWLPRVRMLASLLKLVWRGSRR